MMVSGGINESINRKERRAGVLPCLAVISNLALVLPLRNVLCLGLEYTID